MAVTTYYTVNGEIIGEKTGASARVDYLTDALGNVTATVNQSAQVVNTYRYKPYGALLAKTGVGADPSFQWVGVHGYRQTGKKYSDVYVRARHYDTNTGRWTTKDPIGYGDGIHLYGYVVDNPILWPDPSGLEKPWIPEDPHSKFPDKPPCRDTSGSRCGENGEPCLGSGKYLPVAESGMR